MKKKLEKLSRVVLAIFALLLFFIGGMYFQRYLTEHHAPKIAVVGQVTKVDDWKKVAYEVDNKRYVKVPVANVLQTFGKVGDKVTVYVNQHYPKKIYMKQGATSLLILSLVMLGWAVLISLVLFFEYWFIYKIRKTVDY